MSDDNNGKKINLSDHANSFVAGVFSGSVLHVVVDQLHRNDMSLVPAISIGVAAACAASFTEGFAAGALGVEYENKKITRFFGIGAAIVALPLVLGDSSNDNQTGFNDAANSHTIEYVNADLPVGVPVAMIGNEPLFIPA